MVPLVPGLDTAQDCNCGINIWLVHGDLHEAPFERLVLLNVLAVFIKRCRTNDAEPSARQFWLEDVGGIHRAGRLPGANEHVYLVNEQDRVWRLDNVFDDLLETLLELALRAGSRNEVGDAQLVKPDVLEVLRNVTAQDPMGQALYNGCFAGAGLPHENGVVLRLARKYLQHTTDLRIAAYDRLDLTSLGKMEQVPRIFLQRGRFSRGLTRRRATDVSRRERGDRLSYRAQLQPRCARQVPDRARSLEEREEEMFQGHHPRPGTPGHLFCFRKYLKRGGGLT